MTLSRNFISHYIQWHSTKSTNCTYLSLYSWRLTFLIHQTSFIYCWESVFLHLIVEKCTSRYSICWEALPLSSYCSFNFYSPTSYLLELDFFSSRSIEIRIILRSLAIDKSLQNNVCSTQLQEKLVEPMLL